MIKIDSSSWADPRLGCWISNEKNKCDNEVMVFCVYRLLSVTRKARREKSLAKRRKRRERRVERRKGRRERKRRT